MFCCISNLAISRMWECLFSLVITILLTNLKDLFMRVDVNRPSTAIVQVLHDVLQTRRYIQCTA